MTTKNSEPEPDLSVLKFREDFYRTSHPTPEDTLFIIEVADSSLEKDRKVKLPLYASAGIPEAWIVNLPTGQLERYRRPAQGDYSDAQVLLPGDRIETELAVALILGKSGGNG